eukprot:3086655-Rhodomonas_salina.1
MACSVTDARQADLQFTQRQSDTDPSNSGNDTHPYVRLLDQACLPPTFSPKSPTYLHRLTYIPTPPPHPTHTTFEVTNLPMRVSTVCTRNPDACIVYCAVSLFPPRPTLGTCESYPQLGCGTAATTELSLIKGRT